MTPDVAKRVIEGALLCANRPLAINDIRQLFDEEAEVSPDTVKSLLDELCLDWQGRSVELVSLASGWRFQCASDVASHVLKLQPERVPRYSRAVMETLAIIAYHQPVTRGDIEEIRGVGVSAHIIKTLEDRGWIDQVGVKEVAGRPALFATTRQFLDDLNLRTLKDLPPLDDAAVTPDLLAFANQSLPPPEVAVAIGDGERQAGESPDGPIAVTLDTAGSVDAAGTVDEAGAVDAAGAVETVATFETAGAAEVAGTVETAGAAEVAGTDDADDLIEVAGQVGTTGEAAAGPTEGQGDAPVEPEATREPSDGSSLQSADAALALTGGTDVVDAADVGDLGDVDAGQGEAGREVQIGTAADTGLEAHVGTELEAGPEVPFEAGIEAYAAIEAEAGIEADAAIEAVSGLADAEVSAPGAEAVGSTGDGESAVESSGRAGDESVGVRPGNTPAGTADEVEAGETAGRTTAEDRSTESVAAEDDGR